MDPDNCALACGLVSRSYISQGSQGLSARRRQVKALLSSRRLPQQGWDESTIEMLLHDAALMDSSNFMDNVGVGEREARVACPLVARRHYHLAHGVGRSGDLCAEQPKAAGSSLLAKLTACLATDALGLAGMQGLAPVVVMPVATGMSLTAVLLAAAAAQGPQARTVVWSRIDQKTCLKCITAANLEPHVVELVLEGDELRGDVEAIAAALEQLGATRVAAVVSTTSCFAPRAGDDVVAIAKLCAAAGVPHVINNAYGVQAADLCAAVTSACRKGRVDAIVQSTDKNFMVPVGGALVAAPQNNTHLLKTVAQRYPGRASITSHLDLLITLLYWGVAGWQQLLAAREALLPYLRSKMLSVAEAQGERLLATPGNPISVGMTLASLVEVGGRPGEERQARDGEQEPGCSSSRSSSSSREDVTFFGSMLWSRCISGTRVVVPGKHQTISGISFDSYGAHNGGYLYPYLTAAAALGTTTKDVDVFVERLGKAFQEFKRKQSSSVRRTAARGAARASADDSQQEGSNRKEEVGSG